MKAVRITCFIMILVNIAAFFYRQEVALLYVAAQARLLSVVHAGDHVGPVVACCMRQSMRPPTEAVALVVKCAAAAYS